jgi:hypothetical protein
MVREKEGGPIPASRPEAFRSLRSVIPISECLFRAKLLILTKKSKRHLPSQPWPPHHFLPLWCTSFLQELIGFCPVQHKSVALSTVAEKLRSQEIPTHTEKPRCNPCSKRRPLEHARGLGEGHAHWHVPELPMRQPAGMWKEAGTKLHQREFSLCCLLF